MGRITRVACSGGGMIGSSFAVSFALKGFPCAVYEIDEPSAERARKNVQRLVQSMISLGITDEAAAQSAEDRITVTCDSEAAFRGAQFIQENGPEDYGVKRSILATIEAHTAGDTVIASSTSGLLITEIARDAKHPERCLGAHPYNPPHLIPLLELTKGERTTQETIDTAVDFYRAVNKEPIVLQKERLGFVANRISHALYREVISLVMDGVCSLEDADKAVCFGPGLRWAVFGPNMIYELGGGAGGIGEAVSKFKTVSNLLFEDISDMKRIPDEWHDIAVTGMEEEKRHLPDYVGQSREDYEHFRDMILVELLKLHHKI